MIGFSSPVFPCHRFSHSSSSVVGGDMIGCLRLTATVLLTLLAAVRSSCAPPQAIAKLSFDGVISEHAGDASPVFLSDDTVAVLVRTSGNSSPGSTVLVFRWTGTQIEPIAGPAQVSASTELHAASNGLLIISARTKGYLYSQDLRQNWEVPVRLMSTLYPRSGIIGEFSSQQWRAFRLEPNPVLVREGSGSLLATSDNAVVYQLDRALCTVTTGGTVLGTIRVLPSDRYFRSVEFAGKEHLYFSLDKEQITDFSGKEFRQVRPPAGWGVRHGWDVSGRRLLFDHFIRTAPGWEKIFDRVLGVPEQSNGEIVQVVDTTTGGVCFELEMKSKLLGYAGGYHADLSPSGRWVVVATPADISIYGLAEKCSLN